MSITHKMVIKKVMRGYNPMKALCESDEDAQFLTSDWKFVTCKKCLALQGKVTCA